MIIVAIFIATTILKNVILFQFYGLRIRISENSFNLSNRIRRSIHVTYMYDKLLLTKYGDYIKLIEIV